MSRQQSSAIETLNRLDHLLNHRRHRSRSPSYARYSPDLPRNQRRSRSRSPVPKEESDEELRNLTFEEYRRLKRQKLRKSSRNCIWHVTPSPPRSNNDVIVDENVSRDLIDLGKNSARVRVSDKLVKSDTESESESDTVSNSSSDSEIRKKSRSKSKKLKTSTSSRKIRSRRRRKSSDDDDDEESEEDRKRRKSKSRRGKTKKKSSRKIVRQKTRPRPRVWNVFLKTMIPQL